MAKGKILIVDDEEIVLRAHQEELACVGYEVKIASTGKEAIILAGKEMFDIAYVDLIMPDMDGVKLCKELKKISPKTEVVLVTGHPEQILKQRPAFVNAGGRDEVIGKPTLEDELVNMSNKVIKEKMRQ